jgi:hypothetical protein
MGPSFIACDREQSFLMPPDVGEWFRRITLRGSCSTRSRRWISRRSTAPIGWTGGRGRHRVIAAQSKPDHATWARFIEPHQGALADVFGSVLGLCARAGLVGVTVVAIDGSKVSANASREATVDYERLAREIVEEGRAVDAEEDARFGDRRGDELPPELATSNGRAKWLAGAKRWPMTSAPSRRRRSRAIDPSA